MSAFVADLRFALRMFARNPGATAVAVLSLALAIGPNAALFSVVDRLLLRPSSVPGANQTFRLEPLTVEGRETGISYPDYLDYQAAAAPAAQIAGFEGHAAMIDTAAGPKFVGLHIVTENYFQTLQAKPVAGRLLMESDRQFTGEPPVVLSYSLWQREYGGDPAIVGRSILLNTRPFFVAGVVQRGFNGPGLTPLPVDLWLPVSAVSFWSPADHGILTRRDNRGFSLWARIPDPGQKPRVEAILSGVTARLAKEYPHTNLAQTTVLESPELAASKGQLLSSLVLSLVGLVLLIACANIAGVLLAQGEARRREIAIRLAVGAGRGRLVRQLLTESLLLCIVAAALGLLFAMWLIVGFPKILPPIPFSISFDVHLDARVLAYTLLLSCAAALACGLAPALRVSRPDLFPALKGDTPGSRAHFWFRSGLIVAQIAICQFLLMGASLMARSYLELERLWPGFDPGGKLLFGTVLNLKETAPVDFSRLTESLEAAPGIGRVAYSRTLPLSIVSGGATQEVTLPGSTAKPLAAGYNAVGPGYFSVMGTRFLRGAVPAGQSLAAGESVINDELARRLWGSPDAAMGKFFRASGRDFQVVAVVETGKYHFLLEGPAPYLFLPQSPTGSGGSLAIEFRGDPRAAAATVRQTIRSTAPDVNIFSLDTMGEHMRLARLPQEAGASGFAALGLVGVFLAGCGLYGLMAYRVTRRSHEIGVRMALGARPSDVLALVLRESVALVAAGAAIGVALAIAAARVFSSLLYQVSAFDPLGIIAAVAAVALVALVAAYRPARRAIRVDPMSVLRGE